MAKKKKSGSGGSSSSASGGIALMNPVKTRPQPLNNEPSSEETSDTRRFRKNTGGNAVAAVGSAAPPTRTRRQIRGNVPVVARRRRKPKTPSISSSSSVGGTSSELDEDDDDDEDDVSSSFPTSSSDGGGGGFALGNQTTTSRYGGNDELEEELDKAIRKGKLLSRIDQLRKRGIQSSKEYTYRASEEEMRVEVARMEVCAQRQERIQKGRAAFLTTVQTVEKGTNFVDGKWDLPLIGKFHLKGFTRETARNIEMYDDCLEQGIEQMVGSTAGWPWWVQLLGILLPAMVQYSMLQRFRDPAHTNAVLRENPELQQTVAQEIANTQMRQQQQEQQQQQQQQSAAAAPPPRAGAAVGRGRGRMSAPSAAAPSAAPPRISADYLATRAPSSPALSQIQMRNEQNQMIEKQNRQLQDQRTELNKLHQEIAAMRTEQQQNQQRAAAAAAASRAVEISSSEDELIVK